MFSNWLVGPYAYNTMTSLPVEKVGDEMTVGHWTFSKCLSYSFRQKWSFSVELLIHCNYSNKCHGTYLFQAEFLGKHLLEGDYYWVAAIFFTSACTCTCDC